MSRPHAEPPPIEGDGAGHERSPGRPALGEAHRRGARLSFGYGSDSAREDMNAEIAQSRRRADLLDRLSKAIDRASRT